jgi:titin
LIDTGASDNEIGGDLPGEGNLISGNAEYGILITGATSSGNVIQGNFIGTSASGMDAIPNGYDGVMLRNGTLNNTIGGATPGSRNIISGNLLDGIEIQATNTNGTVVQGNWIGVDASGWGALGNGEYGVFVGGVINDATLGPDNRIAYNGLGGVNIFGADTEGVVITQNSIFQNAYDGIVLTSNGNNNISAPTISTTSMSSVLIEGTACSGCTVEVFTNLEGEDQGRTYIGTATADGSGDWSLTVACIGSPYLTATATDAVDGTSEFSSVFTSSVRCLFMPLIMR